MCNRYRLSASQRDIAERYGVELPYPEDVSFPPGELFPDRLAWVVRNSEEGRVLDVMRWGFPRKVPGKRVDKETGKPILIDTKVTNVRNYSSPFWKSAIANPERRCLVPFSTFCEWSGEKGSKVEHWFSTPATAISSFAGVWRPADAGSVFAFLTCGYEGDPATHPVGAVHPKACPVVLHREDEERWLTAGVNDALSLACPHPSQLLAVN